MQQYLSILSGKNKFLIEIGSIESIEARGNGPDSDAQLEINTSNGWYCYSCKLIEAEKLKETFDDSIENFKKQTAVSTLAVYIDDLLIDVRELCKL